MKRMTLIVELEYDDANGTVFHGYPHNAIGEVLRRDVKRAIRECPAHITRVEVVYIPTMLPEAR